MKIDIYKLSGYLHYFNYILWLLELNIFFCLTCFPFILVVVFIKFNLVNAPIFFITGLLIGPSIYAMFYGLEKIEEDDAVIKNYFNSFKVNFFRVLKIWAVLWFLIILMSCNLVILSTFNVMKFVFWATVLLLCIIITFSINFLVVLSSWNISIREAIRITVKLAIIKSIRYNMSFLILLSTIFILNYIPIYLLFYGVSLSCLIIFINFIPVIEYVNEAR